MILPVVAGLPMVRPNIVLIFSDDHARQAISAYGSRVNQTPNIDRLARNGALFERHYTSNPICAPSRATLLTGKYSHVNGHKDNASAFNGAQSNVAKLLQAGGYETAWIGKWHLVSDPTGFNHWEILRGQGEYYDPTILSTSGVSKATGYTSEVITEKALSFLKKPHDKPFFMVVGHKAPHRPWVPGPNSLSMFKDTRFPEPKTLRTDYATLASGAKTVSMGIEKTLKPQADLYVGKAPVTSVPEYLAKWSETYSREDRDYAESLKSGDLLGANYQRYMRHYLRCVQDVDTSVGQLMDAIKDARLDKNTIIIYASDQGFFLGEKGWFDKRWFYEPSSGTPLVISAPGMKARRVKTLTENVDIAPTLLDFAQCAVDPEMQGVSLVPAMQTGKGLRGYAYGHFYENNDGEHKVPKYVSIVGDRYKLICYYELHEWELFDLKSDPDESKNLWDGSPALEPLRKRMVQDLISKMRQVREEVSVINSVRESLR
jgi:arylsulfatase A-like enzyme